MIYSEQSHPVLTQCQLNRSKEDPLDFEEVSAFTFELIESKELKSKHGRRRARRNSAGGL